MRFAVLKSGPRRGLALEVQGGVHALFQGDAGYPGPLQTLVESGGDALATAARTLRAAPVHTGPLTFAPPFESPRKMICLGLNYSDHAAESGFEPPDYPTLFTRVGSSLIGHEEPMIRPRVSEQLDFEGELVAVIGKAGRHIAKADALGHVAGYSVFNDGSVRDYQVRTPQWTIGKNFHGTGAFGPWFVTADELPSGARGLKLETRLNGQVMQSATTDQMIFDVETTISLLSEAMLLEAGDVLVMGTPSGIGLARKPPVFMKAGDVVEIEIEKVGLLRNTVQDEA